VSEPAATPQWRTGWLWAILAILLVLGTVGAAAVVYGVLGLLVGDPLAAVAIVIGGPVAVLAFLFMAGILYRVDRYRGATMRRVELFE
jgi:hypothetical protein